MRKFIISKFVLTIFTKAKEVFAGELIALYVIFQQPCKLSNEKKKLGGYGETFLYNVFYLDKRQNYNLSHP